MFIKECMKKTMFTLDKPMLAIISMLEDITKSLNLRIRKKDNSMVRIQGKKQGSNGVLQFDTQIFEITPSCHLVHMKQTSDDLLEYQKLLEEGIRPGLKDVVWA
jgi:5'-AMP-activated protein kinase, catalytic alpha subunit